MKLIMLMTSLWLLSGIAYSQERSLQGMVTNAKTKEPLPGVGIKTKDGTKSSVTDAEGHFRIVVSQNTKSLVISSIGYETKEVPVLQQGLLRIELVEQEQSLDEVVVVGYGTQTKRAVTGAVASISHEKFQDRSFSNVAQSLAGQLAGVNISQSQGAPGQSPNIRIRGTSSITAGTNPLYVVDGMPIENFNLNNINPQDIESVEVLKDASSAAIYGSRGANGVVLVTTKLGKAGTTHVGFNYEYGIQKVSRRIDLMDAQQYIQYYIDAHNNGWINSGEGRSASDPNSVRTKPFQIPEDFTDPVKRAALGTGTDWQDVMFRTAPSHQAQLSVSGGTEKTQFLFSGNYLDQEAVLDQNYLKRLTLRSNIRQQVSDRFAIGLNLGVTGVYDRTEGTEGKSDVISLGLQSAPIFPVYNENGNLGFKDPNSSWYRFAQYTDLQLWHPYSLTRELYKQNKSFNTLGNAFAEYTILDGLKFKTSINANLLNTRYEMFWNKDQKYGYSSALPAQGNANSRFMLNWLSENTLNYDKQFNDHGLAVLLGYTVQKQRDEYQALSAGNFPNNLVPTLNAGTVNGGTSLAYEWAMISYLGRVNYNFKNRYFLSAVLRRDGSSRFGANNRFGYFPSISGGWVISDEQFFESVKAINNLKLRASYGATGNNQIPNYGPIGLLGASNYVYGSELATGLMLTNIPNPDLRWERTNMLNLGVDVAFLQDRFRLSAEFYHSVTNDLLLNVPVPDITGFATQLTNAGKLRNRGFELNINSRNIDRDFKWSTDFNLSLNRNKVLQLGPGNAPLLYTDYVVQVKTEVGQPISNFFGYIYDGVYKNQAEIEASPARGDGFTKPGDPKIRDVDGDGRITEADRTIIGNNQPDFIVGLNNSFSFKGIELSFLFQGSFGGEITNQLVRFNGIWNAGRNAFAKVANYWKSESDPGDGWHFKPTVDPKGYQERFSSYWVEDATFVRLKNIRISYALPQRWVSKTPAKGIRIFANAENVYLWSKYTNYDPENTTYQSTSYSNIFSNAVPSATSTVSVPSGAFLGVDYGSYPLPRVITFGAKIDF
ncbi:MULTISPECIES: SusC/RagA family TonB-linked outer membrane protein [Olivibacter]|uniref:SusC/RagA family TonB-linked outer membrane protein n=1 Tax=Olivibacter oleidegradans TaxID=760123 RepID=A0ABV6HRF2_9SPHI|nr:MULTISPECIES: TonB-dependent receptor [unclassified Olivibacter]MDM8176109.1 TonB-dependent receptor [Olivibacter sp. 47]QEL00874.1 TonB-dependent receptor [Olivibacter sp. LS-1]